MIQQMTVSELSTLLDAQPEQLANWQVIDVREPWELERASIRHPKFQHTHIPMAAVPLRQHDVDKSKNVLVMCRTGGRSTQVAHFLLQNGFDKVFNLQGGITAWSREIDPSVPTY
ncbi:MAG: sulfurtransferase [Betaproteobacteria bacterium]|nr:sulfurtransferase [Betaproteobacteria bacterium]MDE2124005.1 sulfurtransferase [Betaproteobacteria bacterium]MDE2185319.1 sulfurtransferase [Betaproteobacteria bacterium]MDE2324355.1 sulfurtransferase [Betaproteobacteria bacterium]